MKRYSHSTEHSNSIDFLNRALIYVFGIIGIITQSEICYIISLTVWVWFIPCVKYEWKLIERYNNLINN